MEIEFRACRPRHCICSTAFRLTKVSPIIPHRREQLRADREELHDRDLLALVGPRPDVDEEAAQVVAQEPRVAAADPHARQERRRAEEQHNQEIPRLRELQLLERAHVGPDEVDRQQVRQAEGPVVQEAREGPPALLTVKACRDAARTGEDGFEGSHASVADVHACGIESARRGL